MGNTYEVKVWESAEGSDHFYWLEIYRGESLLKAIYNLWWCKRHGWKCIKLEYRPGKPIVTGKQIGRAHV